MAGTTVPITINDYELSAKWLEDYVSQALNRHMRGLAGHGIVRGFLVTPGVGDRSLVLGVDPIAGDSVLVAGGRDGAANDDAVTFRKASSQTMDLSAQVLVVDAYYTLAFVANYVVATPTQSEWRLYSDAEVSAGDLEVDDAVVVCRFKSPAAFPGVILEADIHYLTRDDLYRYQNSQGPLGTPAKIASVNFGNDHATKAAFTASEQAFNADLTITPTSDPTAPWPDGVTVLVASAGSGYTNTMTVSDEFEVRPGDKLLFWLAAWVSSAGMIVTPRVIFRGKDGTGATAVPVLPVEASDDWAINAYEVSVPASSYLGVLQVLVNPTGVGGEARLNRFHGVVARGTAAAAGFMDRADRADVKNASFRNLMVAPQSVGGGPWRIHADVPGVLKVSPPIVDPVASPLLDIEALAKIASTLQTGGGLNLSALPHLLSNSFAGGITGGRAKLWSIRDDDRTLGVFAAPGGGGSKFEMVSGASWDGSTATWTYNDTSLATKLTWDTDDGTLSVWTASVAAATFVDSNWRRVNTFTPLKDGVAGETVQYQSPLAETDAPVTGTFIKYLFGFGANSNYPVRVYSSAKSIGDHGLLLVANASYNQGTGQWNRSVGSKDSWFMNVSDAGVSFSRKLGVEASPWTGFGGQLGAFNGDGLTLGALATGAPYSQLFCEADLRISFGPQSETAASSNPPPLTAITNELRAKNVVKAWAAFDLPAPLTATSIEAHGGDGFNIASVERFTNDVVITLAANMGSTDYAILAFHSGLPADEKYMFHGRVVDNSTIYIRGFPVSAITAPGDASLMLGTMHILVLGVQS